MRRTAIVFALFYEVRHLARKISKDKNTALVRAGIGKVRAREATERVIRDFHPELIISAGFCGGLVEDLKVGEIIVSDFEDGKIFCSDRTLFTYNEKVAARGQHPNAIAVDMESEAVYSVAKRAGVDFIAIKAVSDGLRDDIIKPFLELPSFMKLFRFKKNVGIASRRLSEFLFDYLDKGDDR